MDRSDAPVDDEIALVLAPVEGRIVINVSDVDSYDLGRHLLGNSSDGDSDNDDEGVTHMVEMPSAPEPRPVQVDAPFAASTGAGLVFAPADYDFYNAAEKAPHPNSIVPKQESGWWTACEERKQRKAHERELAALQLREVQKQAARLVEQNAALKRELRDTRRSLFGASPSAAPSTSTASVEGPVVVVATSTGTDAPPLSSRLAACAISLRASWSDVGGREFILESRIRLLCQGCSVSPSGILFGFKWRKTSSQVTPHSGAMACHSTTQGWDIWSKSLGAMIAWRRWVRQGRRAGGIWFLSEVRGSRGLPCTPSTRSGSPYRPT